METTYVDEDFLDLIDQAFLEAQIDGETMVLACIWLETNQPTLEQERG